MPQVKSVEEACAFHGIDFATRMPVMSHLPENIRLLTEATIDFDLFNYALKDNKEFDYNNPKEDKHFAWFWLNEANGGPAGFRFDYSDCDSTHSGVGSRLSFFTNAQLMHSINTIPHLWKIIMKGPYAGAQVDKCTAILARLTDNGKLPITEEIALVAMREISEGK